MKSRLSSSSLKVLRQCLRPDLTGMPTQDLEQIVDSSVSTMPAGIAEDFMKTLASLGKTVGPMLQRAAPAIAQSAATGGSVGGPWGALIGAGAGLASAAASSKDSSPSTAGSSPAVTAPPSPSGLPTTPSAPPLPLGQAAAATLLALLRNEAVRNSFLRQTFGPAGNQQVVAASGTSLPHGAINNLLAQLLTNATEGLAESGSVSEQGYLQGESGEYLIDPASPEQQAALVLSHLQARPAPSHPERGKFTETVEWIIESEEWLEGEEAVETVRFF